MIEMKRLLPNCEKDADFLLPYKERDVYVIELDKVIEERCDELDNELEFHGHEIIHRDLQRAATSIYNYKVYFLSP